MKKSLQFSTVMDEMKYSIEKKEFVDHTADIHPTVCHCLCVLTFDNNMNIFKRHHGKWSDDLQPVQEQSPELDERFEREGEERSRAPT